MIATTPKPTDSARSPLTCAVLLLLGTIAIYNFVRREPTAYEWPAIDMGCFFERQRDPTFLPSDYFTNSVSQPNPRHVFGHFVLGVARLLGTDWYGAYFALRCAMTVALPMLWYLALWGMVRPRLTSERAQRVAQIAIAVAIILIMRRNVQSWFSIAWWPPHLLYAGAQPFAQVLGLLAIVLRTSGGRIGYLLSYPTWFCSSLIHPSIGLFLVVFYWLAMFDIRRWRELVGDLFCAVLLPYGLILAWYRPVSPLPAAEFIYYYAHVVHPFHYVLSEFETLTRYPWWVSFANILALLAVGAGVAAWTGNRRLAWTAGMFFMAYGGCVVIQYLGTEVWLSKSIVILGPSRFSILGYYMVALVAVELAATHWPDRTLRLPRWRGFEEQIARLRPLHVAIASAIAIVAMFGLLRDDLQHEIRDRYAALYDWIEQSTDPEDVFLTPYDSMLHRDLPIIGHRAVYATHPFPFCEEAMREHNRRLELAYGKLDELKNVAGRDLVRRRLQFARQLGANDILRLAREYRLDYVVVEADQPSPLAAYPHCYADASVKVYAVAALRNLPYTVSPQSPSVAAEPAGTSALRE